MNCTWQILSIHCSCRFCLSNSAKQNYHDKNVKSLLKWVFIAIAYFHQISACINLNHLKPKELTILHFYNFHQEWVQFLLENYPKKRNYFNHPEDPTYKTRKIMHPFYPKLKKCTIDLTKYFTCRYPTISSNWTTYNDLQNNY